VTRSSRGYDLSKPVSLNDLSEAATGTAIAGSNLTLAHMIYADRDLTGLNHGAADYGVTRTGGWWDAVQLPFPHDAAEGEAEQLVVLPHQPFSAKAHRLLAIITGGWVRRGSRGCDPDAGQHPPSCEHREGRLSFTGGEAARATFGHRGGHQEEQVREALEELYDARSGFLVYDRPSGRYLQERGRVLEYRELGTVRDGPVLYEIAFGRFLLDSLLAGHYTSLPVELVRDLKGSDYLFALHVLSLRRVAKLKHAGETAEANVTTGRRGVAGSLPPVVLGLGGQRPDKLRDSLVRAATRTNEIVQPRLGLRVAIRDNATGGLKVVVSRTTDRHRLRRSPERTAALQDNDAALQDGGLALQDNPAALQDNPAALQDAERARIGGPSQEIETGIETGSSDKRPVTRPVTTAPTVTGPVTGRETSVLFASRADFVAWQKRYRRLPTAKQQSKLDELNDRNGASWTAERLLEAPIDQDALKYAFLCDTGRQKQRGQELARRDAQRSLEDEQERSAAAVNPYVKAVVEGRTGGSAAIRGTTPTPASRPSLDEMFANLGVEPPAVAKKRRASAPEEAPE